MKLSKLTTGMTLAAVFLFSPLFVTAQQHPTLQGLNKTAGQAGFATLERESETEVRLNKIIGTILNTILGFTGAIFMVLIVAAGEMWLTAGGNSEQTEKARGLIFNAVIGLLIVFGSYLAVNFAVPFVLSYTGVL